MSPRPLRLLLSLAAAGLVLGSAPAFADPTPEERAAAAALFEDGRKLLAAGDTAAACGKLSQSYSLDPGLGTLLNLAVCHDKQGKTASAWAEFSTAADLAAAAKTADRLKFATAQVQALAGRLSKLAVRAQGAPAGITVRIDGRDVGAAVLGTAVPLDPGEHRVEVSAPGKRAFTATVTLDPGPATKTLEVPPLADEAGSPPVLPPPPPPGPVAAPPSEPPPPPAPEPGGRSMPRFVAGLAVGSVGLGGVVVGAVFGARTFQKKGDIGTHCDAKGGCDKTGYALQQDAHRSATISTIGFAAGLTAAAGGVVLIVTSGSSSKPSAAAWIAPVPGGLAAGGRF